VNIRSFWIRKDREQYLLSGAIIACVVGAFVSSYWHFADRITVRREIKMNKTVMPEAAAKKLREVQYAPVRLSVGATRYYRLEESTLPSMPKLGENEGD